METWQDRVRSEMKSKGVTQDDLTKVLGVSTRGAVGHYLSGRSEPSAAQIKALADFLKLNVEWVITGKGSRKPGVDVFARMRKLVVERHRRPGDEHLSDEEIYERATENEGPEWLELEEYDIEDAEPARHSVKDGELEFFGHMDAWDSNTPLDEDEVELPLFREVELAAGGGATQVIENHGAKLRFAKSTLRRAGVPVESAACAFVRGNSMEPVMPDGTCVGVNTADKTVRDGEIYAIDHGGMLRVKYLHRRPGGGIKIVSQNSTEHPVEEVLPHEMAESVRIIGRVFWWSVLR